MKAKIIAYAIIGLIPTSGFLATTHIPAIASDVRIYVLITPSHEPLFKKWFRPTLKDKYNLVIRRKAQGGASGSYMGPGWTQATLKKVDLILDAIKENWGKPFIYSDVDIQFFQPTWPTLAALLEDNDMLIQQEKPHKQTCCTGFFVCVANERTQKIWQDVRSYMIEHAAGKRNDDQWGFNCSLGRNPELKCAKLPATFMSGFYWVAQHRIPKGVIMHHANFTIGVKNKMKQLAQVHRRQRKQ